MQSVAQTKASGHADQNEQVQQQVQQLLQQPEQCPADRTILCANCGGTGHVYRICHHPITSFGVICHRWTYDAEQREYKPQYLMVRRKDSLCYVEFIRGKYSLHNKEYIVRLFQNMTPQERARIRDDEFDDLWYAFWQADCNKNYMKEYHNAKDKFMKLRCGGMVWNPWSKDPDEPASSQVDVNEPSISSSSSASSMSCDASGPPPSRSTVHHGVRPPPQGKSQGVVPFDVHYLLEHTHASYGEAEWGFPKGRRNINESDVDCAFREFVEETGFPLSSTHIVPDAEPLEEIFTGCNNIRYKHVYFLARYRYADDSPAEEHTFADCESFVVTDTMQAREVSRVAWLSFDEAMSKIRAHNPERRALFARVHDDNLRQGVKASRRQGEPHACE